MGLELYKSISSKWPRCEPSFCPHRGAVARRTIIARASLSNDSTHWSEHHMPVSYWNRSQNHAALLQQWRRRLPVSSFPVSPFPVSLFPASPFPVSRSPVWSSVLPFLSSGIFSGSVIVYKSYNQRFFGPTKIYMRKDSERDKEKERRRNLELKSWVRETEEDTDTETERGK